MPKIEYAVDVWDLSGTDGRPNGGHLLRHLQDFGDDGWELASIAFNLELAGDGASHLLVFKRPEGATTKSEQ